MRIPQKGESLALATKNASLNYWTMDGSVVSHAVPTDSLSNSMKLDLPPEPRNFLKRGH
jgi:hypothetical protein